jgi:hypothetical protein
MAARPKLEVRPVRNGRGIVALVPFEPGALVCRIGGRVVSSARVWQYWETDPRMAANCIRFDEDRFLNPRGQLGEFANHACDPNTALVKERGALAMRAMRAIRAGEEVTHDYSTYIGADDVWTMRCNCGSRHCRGVVRDVRSIPAGRLRRYRAAGAVPGFILATCG